MAIQRSKDAEVLVDPAEDSNGNVVEDPASAVDPTTKVGNANQIDVNKGNDSIDLAQLGDDGKRREYGKHDFTVSIGTHYDPDDSGHQFLFDAMRDEQTAIVHALYDGTSGFENICVVGLSDGSLGAGEAEEITFELSCATGFLWNQV